MADNYTEFSEFIQLTKDAETTALGVIAKVVAAHMDDADIGYFGADVEWKNHGVWIYTRESGTPEHAASLIQALLKVFNIDAAYVLSYAHVCSKPRVGGFGGGAVRIAKDSMLWYNATELAEKGELV